MSCNFNTVTQSRKLHKFFAIASAHPHQNIAPHVDVVLVASSTLHYAAGVRLGNITHQAGRCSTKAPTLPVDRVGKGCQKKKRGL